MTTKFSQRGPVQKPPHICRKPPRGAAYILPPLNNQIISGFAEYFQPQTPGEGGMISQIQLFPTGPPNTWFGTATAGAFKINLLMASDMQKTYLDFRLDWFVSDSLADTILVNGHQARDWSPFDSGQVTPIPQPYRGSIKWHLWS